MQALQGHAWWGVLAALGLSHLAFILLDTRVPGDQVFLFAALPAIRDALGPRGGGWASLLPLAGDIGGWYNLAVIGLLEALGPSPALLKGILALPAWALALFIGLIARRLGGPGAALGAVSLAAATPLVVLWGRQIWFHVPEAALVTGAAALLLADPALARWRTVLGALLLGALAMTLRYTGLVWVGTLAPLLLAAGLAGARGRLAALTLGWAAAAILPARQLADYLSGKLATRDQYAAAVHGVGDQLTFMLGWGVLALGLLGALVVLWRRGLPWAPLLTLLSWVLLPLVLLPIFQAGLDNHLLIAAGLPALGGLGLAALHPRASWAALALAVCFHALSWMPPSSPAYALGGGVIGPVRTPPMTDLNRPYDTYGAPEVKALLDAACAGRPPRGCFVLVHGGLLRPYSDSTNQLELYLLDEERAQLVPLQRRRPRGLLEGPAHAMVSMRCAPSSDQDRWMALHPNDNALARLIVEQRGFEPAWVRDLGGDCQVLWSTPPGVRWEGLPPSDPLSTVRPLPEGAPPPKDAPGGAPARPGAAPPPDARGPGKRAPNPPGSAPGGPPRR